MQMEWSYVGAVVISGLVIVFVALILLIIAVSIMGKIFDAIRSGKKDGRKNDVTAKAAPAAVSAPVPAPAPKTDTAAADDDEVIAVISAAVAAMAAESGTSLRIKSIRPVGRRTRSNAWAGAAAAEATRTF